MSAHLEDSAVAVELEKAVFIPIPKKGNAKECSNYHTTALISHASNIILKILQARLQQYVELRPSRCTRWILLKAEEPEIKLPTSTESSKKGREFQKNTYFCFID